MMLINFKGLQGKDYVISHSSDGPTIHEFNISFDMFLYC